jgi:transforming growth factor-beta-induced protein
MKISSSRSRNSGLLAIVLAGGLVLSACSKTKSTESTASAATTAVTTLLNNSADTRPTSETTGTPVADDSAPAAAGAAPAPEPELTPEQRSKLPDLVSQLDSKKRFYGTFIKLATQAGLIDVLKGDGPFTVAVPNEAAFAALPADVLASLNADPAKLKKVLNYHVVPALATGTAVADGDVPTLEGSTVHLTVTPTGVLINDAHVVGNTQARNGVFYPIDKVLLPPDL